MSADFALQKAIYERLTSATEIVALVPVANIVDRNSRPAPNPSIVIGEGQSVEGERIDRRDQHLFMDLHVWKKEQGMAGVKAIAGAIRAALHIERISSDDGYQFGDCRVSSIRFLRDPDGETSHGVVSIEALVCEVTS